MNTKKRLSDDTDKTKELLLEERFVTLYEDEIARILAKKEDLNKIEQLNEEQRKELEDAARLYNRVFDRVFFEASGGRVTSEEFLPLWEREEELTDGLKRINSLEGEKKHLEKELDVVDQEEKELVASVEEAERKKVNQRALFRSFFLMAVLASVFGILAYVYLQMPIQKFIWPAAAGVLIVVLLLVILYKMQKKAAENEKLYRMMRTHKYNSRRRLESDYWSISSDLKFYYEKFEVVLGYISEEQWKLFEFCAKVSAELKFCGEVVEKGKELQKTLGQYALEDPLTWLYYPKVLYQASKRISYIESLNYRQNICEQTMVKHEREKEKYQNY